MHQEIEGEWWGKTLLSWFSLSCGEIFDDCCRCTAKFIGKGLLKLVCCPCRCLYRSLQQRPTHATFFQSAIICFYVVFLTAVVFNLGLIIAKPTSNHSRLSNLTTSIPSREFFPSPNHSLSLQSYPNYEIALKCYTSTYIWLSIFALFYLFLHARHQGFTCSRQAMIEAMYLRTGLYIFGTLSIGYSLCLFMNVLVCHEKCCVRNPAQVSDAILHITRAIFVVAQVLFLNSYYKIKLRIETPYIQYVLAYIFAVTLSIWFWTLCMELKTSKESICREFPIPIDKTVEKIFYSVFVEYLLLAASMFYELWSDLKKPRTQEEIHSQQQHWIHGSSDSDERPAEMLPVIPNSSYGSSCLVAGVVSSVVFVILVLASYYAGADHHSFYDVYIWGMSFLYMAQIIFCYVVSVSVQTQKHTKRDDFDYDDALLYFSLAGILLWEGFHSYSIVSKFPSARYPVDEVFVDVLGPLEYIIQTLTLVMSRRHSCSYDRNSKWISYCALLLLITNLAHWFQDSFLIGNSAFEKPGEIHPHGQPPEKFEVLAHILTPLIVFFRFHSATCSFQVWSEFSKKRLRNDA